MDTYTYRAYGINRLKGKGEHTTNDEIFCTFSVFKWNDSLFGLMIQCHLVLPDSSKFKDSGLILRQRSSNLMSILS